MKTLSYIALLALVAVALLAGPSQETAQNVVFDVGYMPILPVAQVFLMEEWAEEEGITFNMVRFPNGPAMVQALASGDLDIMYFGIGPALVARSKGQAIKVLASCIVEQIAFIANDTLSSYFDEANPDTVFDDFQEGEGRKAKVATFPPGSVPEIVLSYWLSSELNVARDSIEIISMGANQVQQALLSDSVDAASILEPVLTIVQNLRSDVQVLARSQQMFPKQPGAVFAVREELLDTHAESLQRLVELHIRATEVLKEDPDAAAPIILPYIGDGLLEQSLIEAALRSPSTNYLANPHDILESTGVMHDFQLSSGSVSTRVDLSELFDTRFYDAAVK